MTTGRVTAAHWAYGLLAASLLIPLSGVAGVIVAHLNLGKESDRDTKSHFVWQIRTFWISFLIGIVLLLAVFVMPPAMMIAWPVSVLTAAWYVYRVLKGWIKLGRGRPMNNPNAFL